MSELVDEGELGGAPDDSLRIELVELERDVAAPSPRHNLQPFGKRRRLRAVVRLEVADHDVDAFDGGLTPFLEHPVCLADSCGSAQENPVAASHRFYPRALP